MKKIVYVLLAEGFEEVETFAPVDLLRRAGVTVETVSIDGTVVVRGARGIEAVADIPLSELNEAEMAMLVLPGGYPGYENLGKSEAVRALILRTVAAGKKIAAICGAPSVLGDLGVLKGERATCYPGMEDTLGCEAVAEPVVLSGQFITSRGVGTALDFALALVAELTSAEKADEIRKGIVY